MNHYWFYIEAYFDYFMYIVEQQTAGISIGFFLISCICACLAVAVAMALYEKISAKKLSDNQKRAFLLMAVYACFIFQIAFYRRFGMEKSSINTRIYFGFRKYDGTVDEKQVVYSFLNVLFFVPWGVLLASCIENNIRKVLLAGIYSLWTSIGIEVLQYITQTGRSEATDLVTNTTGGLIGALLYIVIITLLDKRKGRRKV